MARKRTAAKLHLLTVKQVQAAVGGDHSDGGGLLLRMRGDSCSWVFRYTAPTGRRREMGLGVARRGSSAQAGDSLTTARRQAHEARDQLTHEIDPIDDRDHWWWRDDDRTEAPGHRDRARGRERCQHLAVRGPRARRSRVWCRWRHRRSPQELTTVRNQSILGTGPGNGACSVCASISHRALSACRSNGSLELLCRSTPRFTGESQRPAFIGDP